MTQCIFLVIKQKRSFHLKRKFFCFNLKSVNSKVTHSKQQHIPANPVYRHEFVESTVFLYKIFFSVNKIYIDSLMKIFSSTSHLHNVYNKQSGQLSNIGTVKTAVTTADIPHMH